MLPCEYSVKYVLPAIRLMIAEKLIEEYGFTQSEAARVLGITQASISHYLHSKRGVKAVRKISRIKGVKKLIGKYADKLATSTTTLRQEDICRICKLVIKQKRGRLFS